MSAKGRQVITLNLTITLRVMLVGIFLNPFSPSIYIIFEKLFLYEIGYRVPFKREYFRIKEFDSLSIYYADYADWWWLLSLNGVNEYSNNVQILVREMCIVYCQG